MHQRNDLVSCGGRAGVDAAAAAASDGVTGLDTLGRAGCCCCGGRIKMDGCGCV